MKLQARWRRLRKRYQSRSKYLQRWSKAMKHFWRIVYTQDKSNDWADRRHNQLYRLLTERAYG